MISIEWTFQKWPSQSTCEIANNQAKDMDTACKRELPKPDRQVTLDHSFPNERRKVAQVQLNCIKTGEKEKVCIV